MIFDHVLSAVGPCVRNSSCSSASFLRFGWGENNLICPRTLGHLLFQYEMEISIWHILTRDMRKQTNIVNSSNMYAFASLLASNVFEAMKRGHGQIVCSQDWMVSCKTMTGVLKLYPRVPTCSNMPWCSRGVSQFHQRHPKTASGIITNVWHARRPGLKGCLAQQHRSFSKLGLLSLELRSWFQDAATYTYRHVPTCCTIEHALGSLSGCSTSGLHASKLPQNLHKPNCSWGWNPMKKNQSLPTRSASITTSAWLSFFSRHRCTTASFFGKEAIESQ